MGAILIVRKRRTKKKKEDSGKENDHQKQPEVDNSKQPDTPKVPNPGENPSLDPKPPKPSQPAIPPEPLPPVKPLEGLKDGYGQIGLIKSLDPLLLSGLFQDVASTDKVILPSLDEKRLVLHSLTSINDTEGLFSKALDAKVYPEIILASLNKTFRDSENVVVKKNLGSDIVDSSVNKEVLDRLGVILAQPLRSEVQLEQCSMIYLHGKETVVQGLYRLGLKGFSNNRIWLDFLRVFENRLGSHGVVGLHPQQYLNRMPLTKDLLKRMIPGFDGDLAAWRGRDTSLGDPYDYGSGFSSHSSGREHRERIDQIRSEDLGALNEEFNRRIMELTSANFTVDSDKGFMDAYWKADSFKVYVPSALVRGGEVSDVQFLRYCFLCGTNSASGQDERSFQTVAMILYGGTKLESTHRLVIKDLLSSSFVTGNKKYPNFCKVPSRRMTNDSYALIMGQPSAVKPKDNLFYDPVVWESLLGVQRMGYIPRKSNSNAEINDAILLGFLTDRKIAGRILMSHSKQQDKKVFNDFFDRLDYGLIRRNMPINVAGSHSFDTRYGMLIIHGFNVDDTQFPLPEDTVLKGDSVTLNSFLTVTDKQDIPRISAVYKGRSVSGDQPSVLGDLFFLGGYMLRKASLNDDLEYIYDQVSHSAEDNLSIDERLAITDAGVGCIYRVLTKDPKKILPSLPQKESDYFRKISNGDGQSSALTLESIKFEDWSSRNRFFSIVDDTISDSGNAAKVIKESSSWWETQFPGVNRYVISLIKFI